MHVCIYVNSLSSKAIQHIKNNRSKSKPKNIIKHSKYHGHETSGPGSHVSAVKYPLFLQDFSTKHLILQTSHYIASISVALSAHMNAFHIARLSSLNTQGPSTQPGCNHGNGYRFRLHCPDQPWPQATLVTPLLLAMFTIGSQHTNQDNAKTGGQILSTRGGEGM